MPGKKAIILPDEECVDRISEFDQLCNQAADINAARHKYRPNVDSMAYPGAAQSGAGLIIGKDRYQLSGWLL
jgi:hypothetical protein